MNALENMQDDIYVYIKKIEKGLAGIYNEQGYLNDLKACRDIGWMRERYYREAYQLASGSFDASDGVAVVYLYNGGHELVSFFDGKLPELIEMPLPSGTKYSVGEVYSDTRESVYVENGILKYQPSENWKAAAVLLQS